MNKLTNKLKEERAKHDTELTEQMKKELPRIINESVKQARKVVATETSIVKKRKATKTSDEELEKEKNNDNEEVPLNDYLKKRESKIKRNKKHLRSLGLSKSPITPDTDMAKPKSSKKKTPKSRLQKSSPKKKMPEEETKKNATKPKRARRQLKYDNEDTESEESCTEDHQNYQSNYKEEDNRFYFMENAAFEK